MKVALFFEFTEVGIQLQCKGQLTDRDKHFSVMPVEDFKSADLEENNKKVTRLKTKFTIENTKVVEEGKKLKGDTPETQRSDYNIHM